MKIINSIIKAVEHVALVLFVAMCAMVITQVVARYIFNHPIYWAEEFSLSVFAWVAFLGAAMALRKTRHARVTLLVDKLPKAGKKAAELGTHLLVAVISGVILYQSILFFGMSNTLILTALNVPASFVSASITMSSFLMLLFSIEALIKACKSSESQDDFDINTSA